MAHRQKRKELPPDPRFPLWRIRHPTNPALLWSKPKADWVEVNYTVWTNEEWIKSFGNRPIELNWESFGYHIPLNDED